MASVTLTVKLDVPLFVVVPEITPVELFSVNPLGRLPEIIDQVNGVLPPVAAKVWL